jgi:hypothetical protein
VSRTRAAGRNRGLSPVVGKTLELGVGVLFVALLTATFFGGLAPEYRAAVGSELGDRALVAGAERVEASVPTSGYARLDRRVSVRLPPEISGDPYRIVAETNPAGASLRLVHPDPSIGGRVRLALPGNPEIRGAWRSSSPSRVFVRDSDGRFSVTLVDGEATTAEDGLDETPATAADATPEVPG